MSRYSLFAFKVADQIDDLSLLQTSNTDVVAVQQHDAPAVMNTAIAIVQPVDRRVELIVAANGHQQKLARLQIVYRQIVNSKHSPAARRFEHTLVNRIGQVKTAGLPHSLVVVSKAGNDSFDVVANPIIVSKQSLPI